MFISFLGLQVIFYHANIRLWFLDSILPHPETIVSSFFLINYAKSSVKNDLLVLLKFKMFGHFAVEKQGKVL